ECILTRDRPQRRAACTAAIGEFERCESARLPRERDIRNLKTPRELVTAWPAVAKRQRYLDHCRAPLGEQVIFPGHVAGDADRSPRAEVQRRLAVEDVRTQVKRAA